MRLPQQSSNAAVSEAEPLGHQLDHVGKQGFVECRIVSLYALECIDFENVQHARNLSLDGRITHFAGDQAHFTNRRVTAETANILLATVAHFDSDADATLEDKMHRVSWLTFSSDDLTCSDFESPTLMHQIT